jgi:ubiquinone/menaquinone biosynthesis C-methylase UbiE
VTEPNKQQAVDVHTAQADQFAERYDVRMASPYSDCFTYSRHRLETYVSRYLPEQGNGAALLDVGCGTGHYVRSLRERGYDAAGVDASEGMLAHARINNPGARIEAGDVDHLPFADGAFDYVLSIEVLRYLARTQSAISEMARVLKPGGVALVTAAPALSLNGYAAINKLTSRLPVGNLTRLRQYFTTSGRMRREFRNAGFGEVTVHGVYFGPLNWVERLARPILGGFLRKWERVDRAVSDRPVLRDLSNMYLIRAIRR